MWVSKGAGGPGSPPSPILCVLQTPGCRLANCNTQRQCISLQDNVHLRLLQAVDGIAVCLMVSGRTGQGERRASGVYHRQYNRLIEKRLHRNELVNVKVSKHTIIDQVVS
jgi:hypothetical protein